MAFPPVFTDVWDTTQPPDTQLANLLGQDIRNLKLDIMQRMSLLSGNAANIPTPETVNAVWGGAGFGLIFFATDTGQIFQWSGAAWVNVTGTFFGASKRYSDTATYTFNTSGAHPTTGVTIPANTLAVGSSFHLVAGLDTSGSGSVTASLLFGASNAGFFISSAAFNYLIDVDHVITGGSNPGSMKVFQGAPGGSSPALVYSGPINITINTAANLTISTSYNITTPFTVNQRFLSVTVNI